jgi:hypothetical protein
MIIWCGICDGTSAYRTLGGKQLYRMPTLDANLRDIAHSEGTTLDGGTSPCIGTGDSKVLRDYACRGITVGKTIGDPLKEPRLLRQVDSHVMAYDIESEFHGRGTPSFGGRILCGCNHVVHRRWKRKRTQHCVFVCVEEVLE